MDNLGTQAIIEYLESSNWQLVGIRNGRGHEIQRDRIIYELKTHHFRFFDYAAYFFYTISSSVGEIVTSEIFQASEIIAALDEQTRYPQDITNAGFKNVHVNVGGEGEAEAFL